MKVSEYDMVSKVIVPYLEENWNTIDCVETVDKASGRLTREKLFIRYLKVLNDGNIFEALVLEAIIERYDSICLAYEDAYIPEEEAILGISEEDISVYMQKLEDKRSATAELRPKRWLPAKAS